MPAPSPSAPAAPTWSTWREALQVVFHPPFLKRTLRIAVLVGCILFLINHFDEVLAGRVATSTWIKGLATFVVPFSVSNWGILTATRRRE